MRTFGLMLVLLVGCGFEPNGGATNDDVDASAVVDDDVDAELALGGLNASCAPLRGGCTADLTCRPRTADTGLCRPIAAGRPGDPCVVDDHCGAGMACVAVGRLPDLRCATVCDVIAPSCGAQACDPVWGIVGVCQPAVRNTVAL